MTGRAIARRAGVCLLVAMLSVLVACDDRAPIRIGFIGGLSGRSADIGEPSRNAVQLAVQVINQAGGISGRPIALLVRDDANDPDVAAEAVRNLHAAGVSAIVGPNNSAIAVGMLPILDELQMIAVSPTASSLTLAGLDDYLFRINWTTRDNAQIYAQHYAAAGVLRVAAAVDTNNRVFSESWLQEFAGAFEPLGGKVVARDFFDAGAARGYSDTARRLLESGADAILLIANSVDTAQLAQQIRKLNGDTRLIAAEWAASERLLFLGGSAIEGLELVQSYDRGDRSESYLRFLDAFRNQFQRDPGYSGIAAYDAALVLFRAFAEQRDGRSLKDALVGLPTVQGLQQPIKFDRFGDAQRRAYFVMVRGGKFVAL